MKSLLRFLFVLGGLALFVAQEACNNETCATYFNRTCSPDDDCLGPCLLNYTDFGNRTESCFAIADINWEMFVNTFDPIFLEDLTPAQRLKILVRVAIFISEFNQNNPNVTLGINRYSADSQEDLRAKTGFRQVNGSESMLAEQDQNVTGAIMSSTPSIPSSRDWVEEGAVTSVKDQGRCGCCWGISLSGAIEGAAAIKSNFTYLQSVSFQQFISCDKLNYGCDGGNIVLGMAYAAFTNERGGMARLNDYPYTDEKGETTENCNLGPERAVAPNNGTIVVTFDDGRDFEERMARMKYAVSRQPVSMVLKSTCNLFNNYRSGVVTDDQDCRCEEVDCIDHAVLLVGYSDEDPTPYWKIKNSWGSGWGEGGYMRIAQEAGDRRWGLFGLLSQGVVALDVQNVTGQVEDVPESTSLENWQIALIAVVSFLAALLCCCGIMACLKKK
jgi:cathepsin L